MYTVKLTHTNSVTGPSPVSHFSYKFSTSGAGYDSVIRHLSLKKVCDKWTNQNGFNFFQMMAVQPATET